MKLYVITLVNAISVASIVRNSRQIIWNHALISIVIQAIELKDVFRNSIISLPNRSYYSRSSNALGGLSMSTSSHTMVVDHKPRWRSKSPIGVFPITIFWIAFLITTCDMPITATTMISSMWILRSELMKSGSKNFHLETNVNIRRISSRGLLYYQAFYLMGIIR